MTGTDVPKSGARARPPSTHGDAGWPGRVLTCIETNGSARIARRAAKASGEVFELTADTFDRDTARRPCDAWYVPGVSLRRDLRGTGFLSCFTSVVLRRWAARSDLSSPG